MTIADKIGQEVKNELEEKCMEMAYLLNEAAFMLNVRQPNQAFDLIVKAYGILKDISDIDSDYL